MSDFTNELDVAGTFTEYEEDTGVDFTETGDQASIIIPAIGWGDGGWGDFGWGGEEVVIMVSNAITVWTNIDTP